MLVFFVSPALLHVEKTHVNASAAVAITINNFFIEVCPSRLIRGLNFYKV